MPGSKEDPLAIRHNSRNITRRPERCLGGRRKKVWFGVTAIGPWTPGTYSTIQQSQLRDPQAPYSLRSLLTRPPLLPSFQAASLSYRDISVTTISSDKGSGNFTNASSSGTTLSAGKKEVMTGLAFRCYTFWVFCAFVSYLVDYYFNVLLWL